MKRIITALIVVVITIVLTPAIYSASEPTSITIENKEIPYELPNPGLLPDHPLYFFKTLRDTILIITTRDNFHLVINYSLLEIKNQQHRYLQHY